MDTMVPNTHAHTQTHGHMHHIHTHKHTHTHIRTSPSWFRWHCSGCHTLRGRARSAACSCSGAAWPGTRVAPRSPSSTWYVPGLGSRLHTPHQLGVCSTSDCVLFCRVFDRTLLLDKLLCLPYSTCPLSPLSIPTPRPEYSWRTGCQSSHPRPSAWPPVTPPACSPNRTASRCGYCWLRPASASRWGSSRRL